MQGLFDYGDDARAQARVVGTSGCLESEDRGADLLDGLIELVDRTDDLLTGVRFDDRTTRTLKREADREQTLDHDVVQVARDAFAILSQRQPGVIAAVLREFERHRHL